jgi:ComF family protein
MTMMAAAHEQRPVDLIIPVPLHWRRLLMRRFNQSALLGFSLSRSLAVPCVPTALKRTRYTTPQMRLPRAQRLKNVRNAFAVPDAGLIADKHVLLVDDVVTTGATVAACAATLKKAGAASVHVLALARTVKE